MPYNRTRTSVIHSWTSSAKWKMLIQSKCIVVQIGGQILVRRSVIPSCPSLLDSKSLWLSDITVDLDLVNKAVEEVHRLTDWFN